MEQVQEQKYEWIEDGNEREVKALDLFSRLLYKLIQSKHSNLYHFVEAPKTQSWNETFTALNRFPYLYAKEFQQKPLKFFSIPTEVDTVSVMEFIHNLMFESGYKSWYEILESNNFFQDKSLYEIWETIHNRNREDFQELLFCLPFITCFVNPQFPQDWEVRDKKQIIMGESKNVGVGQYLSRIGFRNKLEDFRFLSYVTLENADALEILSQRFQHRTARLIYGQKNMHDFRHNLMEKYNISYFDGNAEAIEELAEFEERSRYEMIKHFNKVNNTQYTYEELAEEINEYLMRAFDNSIISIICFLKKMGEGLIVMLWESEYQRLINTINTLEQPYKIEATTMFQFEPSEGEDQPKYMIMLK